jgi:hypothetical protein
MAIFPLHFNDVSDTQQEGSMFHHIVNAFHWMHIHWAITTAIWLVVAFALFAWFTQDWWRGNPRGLSPDEFMIPWPFILLVCLAWPLTPILFLGIVIFNAKDFYEDFRDSFPVSKAMKQIKAAPRETTKQFDKDAQADETNMENDQQSMLGVQSVNVQQQYNDAVNSVQTPSSTDQQIDSTGDAFMKDSPDLPFSLPFGLNKIFGIHPKDKKSPGKPSKE